MGRILAIDLGKKRTGLAVTDPLQLIANPLDYIETPFLMKYLKEYAGKEEVEAFVVGMPRKLDNSETEMTAPARSFIEKLKKSFPGVRVHMQDERFTSKIALQSMVAGGMKKKNRRVKGNADKISATLILQSFLEKNNL